MSALSGMRVVELAHDATAFAGKLMADMGADVILVETPGGHESRDYPPFLDDKAGANRSLHWWHYHTNKRGVVIDLANADGVVALRRLLASADVFLEAETPGRLKQLGVATQAPELPELIHVAISSHGQNHPDSLFPYTDLTIMAGAGPPWSCGYDDHDLPPIRGPGQGLHTGAHFAVMSTLTAFLHRLRGGGGQFIDVSLHAASNVTTEAATYAWLVSQLTVQRQTGRHAAVQPTGVTQQRCADGRFVNTGVPPRFPVEFARLLEWLQTLGLTDEFPEAVFLQMGADWEGPFDLSKIGEDDTISAIFGAGRDALSLIASKVKAQEFFTGAQRAGLAVGVINAPEEAFEDEHFIARGFQVELEQEEGTVRYPGAPYRLTGSPWALRRRAPRLGEHTAEVFAEVFNELGL